MSDRKRAVESAVELAVFAPIGFALEAKKLLPTFVERGRQQVNMAKMVGQFAVAHGQNTATKRLEKVQDQAESVLAEFGLGASDPEASPPEAPLRGAGSSAAEEPVEVVADVQPIRSSAAAADLAISDYDSLAASQVIPRLAGLSEAELDAVRLYELDHRGRKTILGKISQLSEA